MTLEVGTILLFAVVAAFVLYKLYDVLGRRVGRQPEDVERDLQARSAAETPAPSEPVRTEVSGLATLKSRDPGFDPVKFLEGAREAYQTIVKAFAAGDRAALKPLLAAAVDQSFEAAIAQRESEGRSQSAEFLQSPRADLERVDVDGDQARARVRFLAELRTRSKGPEGEAVDDRRTAELWTFERTIGAADPTWLLSRVEAAEA
ncbi:MAG: TIM44-related membrane protein TimA [Proteobacteria bacterium]|nr:TIM44-related membrane protein TimA [Pseudomonadota bacterium]